jgi:hypothetical protein
MISLLQSIVDHMTCWFMTGGVFVVDAILTAIGFLATAAIAVLPGMPVLPTMPSIINNGFVFGQYYFPVSYFFTLAISVGVLWLIWLVVAIPLRWGKVVPGED